MCSIKTIVLGLIIALLLTFTSGCKNEEAQKAAILDAQQEAERIIAQAHDKAQTIMKGALARADKIEYDRLKSKLSGLAVYPTNGGRVELDSGYLAYFKRTGGEIIYSISNRGAQQKIRPNFNIIFYDSSGVTTGHANIIWLINSVGPNSTIEEREKVTGEISPEPTKYYRVVFN